MKANYSVSAERSNNVISLNQLVNNFVSSTLPAACQKNTQLVNEVEQEIALSSRMQNVFDVMEELLSTVVANSQNGNIHISADRFRDIVILEIQERNNNNGYALSYQIDNIGPDAAAIGGHISIAGHQKKITTISFSFPYQGQVT